MPPGGSRSTLATIAAVLALAGAACHGEPKRDAAPPPRAGPPGLVRVALAELPWPLDPALADSRDELTVARALYATPFRTDPATGELRAGLCRVAGADPDPRTWRFVCDRADLIAAALRRVGRMRDSPWRWLFAPVTSIEAPDQESLVVRLRFPWQEFPYALTVPAAAPRGLPGPFRLVSAGRDRIVAERPGLRLVFLRLEPRLAVRAFRSGIVDEAPVPVGRIRATRSDSDLGDELRVRPIRGVDLVDLGGRLAGEPELRAAYWRTAARADYEALVPEFTAPQAFGLLRVEGAEERASPRLFRAARNDVPSLPRIPLALEVAPDPESVYRAQILWAAWRDLGLRPTLIPRPLPGRPGAARFRRLIAAYPQPDARLVSARLSGWRRDALGAVDYTRVRARARSPSR